MIETGCFLWFDKHIPNEESHTHRIVQFYKRAVLNENEKTWSHFFRIGKKVVNVSLNPLEGFFDSSNLIVSCESRYEMLKNAIIRTKGICRKRLIDLHSELSKSNHEKDWLQVVDLLDDLEDLIFETEEDKATYREAKINQFINTFNFIKVKAKPEDQEIQEGIAKLNDCARFYYCTNLLANPARCKSAIKHAENAINKTPTNKDTILQKVENAYGFVSASFTKKNLTRSVRMISYFDRTIILSAEQEDSLLPTLNDAEIDEKYAQSIFKEVEECSGMNIVKSRKDFKVKFDKKHWDDIFTNIENLIDFANIPLTDELVEYLENFSALLIEDRPDNEVLDLLSEFILAIIIPLASDVVMDHFSKYKSTPTAYQKKISSISDQLGSDNILSAYVRIIDLKIN